MATRTPLINVMANAAFKAARALVRDFGEVEQLQVSLKGPSDFVSNADHKAERTLRQELEKARPGFGFLMEESGVHAGTDERHRWIVDPLDGTTNFLHGIPHFAISVALERDGELVAGIVYQPVGDELFWAERGVGAYLNERRLRVSARRNMSEAVIATGMPWRGKGDHAAYLRMLPTVMAATSGIRRMGAASLDLAYVAAGRFDGYWETGLQPWDMAAGILLVKEAGGYVTEFDGRAHMLGSGELVAANDHLHGPLRKLLRGDAEPARATA